MTLPRWKRRRRRPSDDVVQLMADISGDANVVGFYDYRFRVSVTGALVDSWADPRDAAVAGPALAGSGAGRPSLSSGGITFDGIAHFLRNAAAGRFAEVTQDAGLIVVGALPTTGAADRVLAEMGVANGAVSLSLRRQLDGTLKVTNTAATTATATGSGRRVSHGRRLNVTGTVTVAVQSGSAAEATASAVSAAVTVGSLTVGGTIATTPLLFGDVVLAALIVFKGDYTAALHTIVNTWAAAVHGTTL